MILYINGERLMQDILNSALITFWSIFFTIDVLGTAPIFISLTAGATRDYQKKMAQKGALTAFCILFVFTLSGSIILDMFGVSLSAFRIAGGILLLLLAIDMVMAKPDSPIKTETAEERQETLQREDISVFPLAIPLLSGPAAITVLILLMKQFEHVPIKQFMVIVALVANILICWVVLTFASKISRFLGRTGINVLTRIFGILLTALACQFFIDGIIEAFHLK